ncbi:hypothetical protein ACFLZ7_02815 [Nanoarchaeota archaeon]
MRIGILGPTDYESISEVIGVSQEEVDRILDETAKYVAEIGAEIVVVPDGGTSSRFAKAYKEHGGKKVIGIIPRKDPEYGIKHLEPYISLLGEEIDVPDWNYVAPRIVNESDEMIVLGLAPGVFIELGYSKFNIQFKLTKLKNIFVYSNLISNGKIQEELESRLINVIKYIKSPEELKSLLK